MELQARSRFPKATLGRMVPLNGLPRRPSAVNREFVGEFKFLESDGYDRLAILAQEKPRFGFDRRGSDLAGVT